MWLLSVKVTLTGKLMRSGVSWPRDLTLAPVATFLGFSEGGEKESGMGSWDHFGSLDAALPFLPLVIQKFT